MAKEIKMQNTEAEFKAVAKAVGASLKRSGHPVPQTAVLNALAAAMDKRTWNILKASIAGSGAPAPIAAASVPAPEPLALEYTDGTWFLLRLAYFQGHGVPPAGMTEEPKVRTWAKATANLMLDGVLIWEGWTGPATLNVADCSVDGGDLLPDVTKAATTGILELRSQLKHPIPAQVAYKRDTGWYLTQVGAAAMTKAFEELVSKDELLAAGLGKPSHLPGSYVNAEAHTDDRVVEVAFDARPYLSQASESDLLNIMTVGFGGDYATDNIADWESSTGKNEDLMAMYTYMHALRQSSSRAVVGFECTINGVEMLTWLSENRPEALARVLCAHFQVVVDQVEAGEELAGRWDWYFRAEGQGSDCSLDDKVDAEMDAYRCLNLLDRALDYARDC